MIKKVWNRIGEYNRQDMEACLWRDAERRRKNQNIKYWFGGHELSARQQIVNKITKAILGWYRY